MGCLSYINTGKHTNNSQFFITLTNRPLDHLDGKNTLFGNVVESEGLDVIAKFNDIFTDNSGKPFQEVRIYHTIILIDPFEKEKLVGIEKLIPPNSPTPVQDKYLIDANIDMDAISIDQINSIDVSNKRELESRAVMLEIAGDLPDSEMKPPDTTLFVCKLNRVTTEDDLEIIFGRFGKVKE
jgi:peptidyl-prolyl cis-trans isomerase-like 4